MKIRACLGMISLAMLVMLASCLFSRSIDINENDFEYCKVYEPNPLKGFVSLYPKPSDDSSLEYIGFKFSDVYQYDAVNGFQINAEYIDDILQRTADRGNSLICRTYIVYPGYNNSDDTGLYLPEKIYDELRDNGDIYSNQYGGYELEYPDFNSPLLMKYMTNFIAKLGEKYDGHPAIAAVQLGMYGSWGEWNMSGCNEYQCIMTNENLNVIIEAYTNAFKTTKLMARNPSLGRAYEYDIGFHDDNFLFNSSDFHTKSSEWKSLLESIDKSYGTLQQFYDFINGCNGNYEPIWEKWQTEMFGGELSGMMYNDPFGPILYGPEREALDYCIKQFHVTCISGVGRGGIPEKDTAAYGEYIEIARSFGYEIGITEVNVEPNGKLDVTLRNYGVAPFYYDWQIEYAVVNSEGDILCKEHDDDFKLSGLLPQCELKSTFIFPKDLENGEYKLTMRIVNPAEDISANARPMTLANDHKYKDGIYELASVVIR